MRVVRAVGVTTALAVAWLVTFGLVDRLSRLSAIGRGALLASLVTLVVFLIGRAIYRWRYRPVDPAAAAREIERRDPALAERLQTVISQRALPARLRASEALLAHIQSETATELQSHPVKQLLPTRELRPAFWLAMMALAIAVGLLFVPMLGWKTLLARQIAPWAKIAPVSTTVLHVLPGDQDVPQGSAVTVRVQAEHLGSGRVVLRCGTDRKSLTSLAMSPAGDGSYELQIDSVEQDLFYQAQGGDAESPFYRLRTMRRPVVRELDVKCDYPEYLGQKPMSFVSTDGRIEVPRGTLVQVSVVASEPLNDASITVAGIPIETTATVDHSVRSATFEVQRSSEWSVDLKSDRGVSGSGPEGMSITSIDDRVPMIQLMRTDLRLHPRDVLALPFQATDDYGLAKVRTEVKKGETVLKTRDDVPAQTPRLLQDVVSIDLAGSGLEFGDVVTITLTATDTAGQEKVSSPCQILLSPRSVDPRALRRVESLREAMEFAELVDQHPDYAIDAQRALLRAIPLSDDAAMLDVLSLQIARAQQIITSVAWSTQPDQLPVPQKKRLEEMLQILRTLYQGESARILLADAENIRAMQNAGAKLSEPEKAALKLSVERAQAEWSSSVEQLQLDPSSPQTSARLGERDARLVALLKQSLHWDASRCVGAWQTRSSDAREMRDCMSVASQVQVLRHDADFVWARDLQLAARAMIVIDESNDKNANRKDDGKDRHSVVGAVDALAQAHRVTPTDATPAAERLKISQRAEAARETLRRLAGESKETIAQRSDWEQSLEEAAEMDDDLEQTSASASEGPEKWEPTAKGNGQGGSKELAEARSVRDVAHQQAQLNQQDVGDPSAASIGQKQVAAAIGQLVDHSKEDFFDKNQAGARSKALDAIRDAQQKLAEMPQEWRDLRRQGENLRSLTEASVAATHDAQDASAEALPAAQRMAGLSGERAAQAREALQNHASAARGSASAAMSAAQSQLAAADVGLSGAALQRFDDAMQQLSSDLVDSHLDAADKSQSRALEAVANLQSSLRIAQRQLMERDPLVSAKYFADQAGTALGASPPRVPEASEAQKQTSASLGMAWDAALARGMTDKMKSMSAFRSLLVDEYSSRSSSGISSSSSKTGRALPREWGRLSARESAGTFGAGPRESMAEGYEESIKTYFDALSKVRGDNRK